MVVNVDEWVRSFGLELAFAACAEAAKPPFHELRGGVCSV